MNEIERLGKILKKLRNECKEDGMMDVALHYFVIKYSNHLQGFDDVDLENILGIAGYPLSYTAEIRKMLKLSEYVSIKQNI